MKETAGIFFRRDKQVNLPPQLGILAASAVEKRPPSIQWPLQCSVEQILCSAPKFRPHLPFPCFWSIVLQNMPPAECHPLYVVPSTWTYCRRLVDLAASPVLHALGG